LCDAQEMTGVLASLQERLSRELVALRCALLVASHNVRDSGSV
jgi:hypothetical protein